MFSLGPIPKVKPNGLSTMATIFAEFGDNLSPVWTGLNVAARPTRLAVLSLTETHQHLC